MLLLFFFFTVSIHAFLLIPNPSPRVLSLYCACPTKIQGNCAISSNFLCWQKPNKKDEKKKEKNPL